MEIDTLTLRKKIGSVFITNKEFEEAIGKSHSFVSLLLNGKKCEVVDLGTIYKIKEVLNLTDTDITKIFFYNPKNQKLNK